MTDKIATLVGKLKTFGYALYVDGDKVKYRYTLPSDPPPDKVKPLLDELRNHKEEVITHLQFKNEFNRLAEHLRQSDYTTENFSKLQTLSLEMNATWEAMDYPKFKEVIDVMLQIPGILRSEGEKPVAAKIFSHILQDHVWIALDPTFKADDGIPVYMPEEIRNLRGATPEDIRTFHRVKKELGGQLISVNQSGEG